MIRRSTWEADLNAYIAAMRDQPFEWGVNDCAMFAAGAVIAMTGVDPIPEFRDKYTTATGSARALVKYGAGTLDATLDQKFEARAVAFLRRGDLVWHDAGVGICMGAHAMFVGQEGEREGLLRIERNAWVKGWAVG